MDLALLKSFVAVAEEGSFSTAAKHLFISQQSISKQVARLEEELGCTLLIRSHPLHLTPDGKLFLQTAKEILQLKQEFEDNAGKNAARSTQVHIGIEHTIARALLPHVLPRYMAEHPEVYFRVSEESPEDLERAIAHEGVDLVIGSISNPPASYRAVELCKKEQLLVVPKSILRSLAGDNYDSVCFKFSRSADLKYFENAPFIKQPRNSSGGRSLQRYLKYYDISPRFVCELTNVENAFQLALSGLGVLVYAKLFWDMVSPKLQRDYLDSIELFPLPYLPDTDKVCAYTRADVTNRHTQELLELFRGFFEEYEHGTLRIE